MPHEFHARFLMGNRDTPLLEFRPSNNNAFHRFSYGGRAVLLQRTKGQTLTVGWNRMPKDIAVSYTHLTLPTILRV